jgi:hypothetical protein
LPAISRLPTEYCVLASGSPRELIGGPSSWSQSPASGATWSLQPLTLRRASLKVRTRFWFHDLDRASLSITYQAVFFLFIFFRLGKTVILHLRIPRTRLRKPVRSTLYDTELYYREQGCLLPLSVKRLRQVDARHTMTPRRMICIRPDKNPPSTNYAPGNLSGVTNHTRPCSSACIFGIQARHHCCGSRSLSGQPLGLQRRILGGICLGSGLVHFSTSVFLVAMDLPYTASTRGLAAGDVVVCSFL